MTEHEASRTLVKSPPELWAECSEAASLARHLDGFGEIRITRLEPESTVAWEGEAVSGTVRLEPSGWGTRVILTALGPGVESVPEMAALGRPPLRELEPKPSEPKPPEPEPEPEPEPLPPAAAIPPGPARRGLRSVLRRWLGRQDEFPPVAEASPAAGPIRTEPVSAELTGEPDPEPGPEAETLTALTAALESLGQAHRRPFSRG